MQQSIFVKNNINRDLEKVYDVLLHNGLTKYKTKYSKHSLFSQVEAAKQDKLSKKGAIFVVRSKRDFLATGVKGYIITSKETLLEDAAGLTHFTPNIYRKFGYSDEKRRMIRGFEEKNLLQINTFVVDIDTKNYSVQEILMACMDDSIGLPTMIVETDCGYQVYFVLENPLFISNKYEFRGLKVAKRISDNLKRSLKAVEADQFCNAFGFFRLPKADNIVWIQLENTYDMATFINWSTRFDDNLERPLFVVPSKLKATSVMDSEWFQALIYAVDVKGEKGQIGRNNTMFTLALVCFSEGWEKGRTFDFIDEYNARLRYPLKGAALQSIIESAYSGKYKGASKEYIEALLAIYVQNGRSIKVNFRKHVWYKFKKEREDRKRSHYEEWEQDIIEYIKAEKNPSEPFIWRTQKEICEAIGIPQSTLNQVLKVSKKIVKTVTGKGCNAKTGWSTVSLFIQYGVLPTKRGYYTLSKFQSKKPNSSALRNQLLNFCPLKYSTQLLKIII